MEDKQIVDLFWQRSEAAIVAAASKYGKYCSKIAYNILQNYEDSEECVNDTYLKAWGAIPTHRPTRLSTFLGKITRNLALNKWEYLNAEKRGSGQISFVLEELQECVPDVDNTEKIADDLALIEVLNHFLAGLPKEQRIIFLRRYWYLCSVKEIAANHSIMREINVVSRARISENGKSVLYEKRYHGILTENGCVRLKAYCAKRVPLGAAGTAKSSPQAEENMKSAA